MDDMCVVNDEVVFSGFKPKVTLTSWIVNDTGYNLAYMGSYINHGFSIDPERTAVVKQKVFAGNRELMLAAVNSPKCRDFFRGTSGAAVWKVEGTNFCLVVAWKVPKYRRVKCQSNTMAVGLFMNPERFGENGSKINRKLYEVLMRSGSENEPGITKQYANFLRFSCSEKRAGSINAAIFTNNRFQVEVSFINRSKKF